MEISSLTSKKGWGIHMNKEKKNDCLKILLLCNLCAKRMSKRKKLLLVPKDEPKTISQVNALTELASTLHVRMIYYNS